MLSLNLPEIFLRPFYVKVIEGDHHIQIKKIIPLNGHLFLPNLADVIPLIYLKEPGYICHIQMYKYFLYQLFIGNIFC